MKKFLFTLVLAFLCVWSASAMFQAGLQIKVSGFYAEPRLSFGVNFYGIRILTATRTMVEIRHNGTISAVRAMKTIWELCSYGDDAVVIYVGSSASTVSVGSIFSSGTKVKNEYNGETASVGSDGTVTFATSCTPVLIGAAE